MGIGPDFAPLSTPGDVSVRGNVVNDIHKSLHMKGFFCISAVFMIYL